MADFLTSLNYCLKNEGKFVNNPSDPGGATNMGVTIGEWSKFKGFPAQVSDIEKLTMQDVIPFYRQTFWKVMDGDNITKQSIATAIFDFCVNQGQYQAIKLAQQTCIDLGGSLTADGVMGPKTIYALNTCNTKDFLQKYRDNLVQRYQRLAVKNPDLETFLHGWTNRADKILELA